MKRGKSKLYKVIKEPVLIVTEEGEFISGDIIKKGKQKPRRKKDGLKR